MEKIAFFGIEVERLTFGQAVHKMKQLLHEGGGKMIATPNTEIAMAARKNIPLRHLINDADMVVPDGIGLIIGAKLRHLHLPERVTGYDLSMELLRIAEKEGYRLFLLGGRPSVAKKAMENLKEDFPALQVVGAQHGYFKGSHNGCPGHEEERAVLRDIRDSGADIVFVGLGFPKQEQFIHRFAKETGARLLIGNGGVIDVLAGEAKRAPEVFIKLHLEWFYRLLKNPSRWKRQLAIPQFLYYVIMDEKAVTRVIK